MPRFLAIGIDGLHSIVDADSVVLAQAAHRKRKMQVTNLAKNNSEKSEKSLSQNARLQILVPKKEHK